MSSINNATLETQQTIVATAAIEVQPSPVSGAPIEDAVTDIIAEVTCDLPANVPEAPPAVMVVATTTGGENEADAPHPVCGGVQAATTTSGERNFAEIDSIPTPSKSVVAPVDGTSPTEEDDHLSPLMIDNHTVTEHQETFKPSSITCLQDIADRVHEIPEFKPAAAARQTAAAAAAAAVATPMLRDCEPNHSLGSDDSDFSSSPQRSSDEASSAKDSGCELVSDGGERSMPPAPRAEGLRRGSDLADGDAELLDGGDEDTSPIEMPSDELAAQIVVQVQFYFSNENILKDAFLLKHVRRNKEGFVSLKLISSFKRVRQLTKDWRVVGVAIKRLAAVAAGGVVAGIELNELGSKVRRVEPLPVFDETMPSRTVVATELPVERLTIESVSELFGKCGEIALIRILRPGGTIPADVRQFYNKHPELHERECALVEFTESQAARVAHELPGMQTYEMVAPKKKTGKKAPGGGNGGSAGAAHVSRIIEGYRYPSYADIERSRGGELAGGDYKYGLRRGSAGGYFVKYHEQNNGGNNCHYRRPSFGSALNGGVPIGATAGGNEIGVEQCGVRRLSNCSIGSGGDLVLRKISNCSDGYCGSDVTRRVSACSQESSRRASQCSMGSDAGGVMAFGGRRISQCSDYCPCSRRLSQCPDSVYRRSAQQQQQQPQPQCMEHGNHQRYMGSRRVSFDSEFNGERKLSGGPFGFERKLSATSGVGSFEAMRKLSSGDRYYDARKMSNDSGYDRRSSVGSMASEQRFVVSPAMAVTGIGAATVAKADPFVRTPIGPDGSKGFTMRARKIGQDRSPVTIVPV